MWRLDGSSMELHHWPLPRPLPRVLPAASIRKENLLFPSLSIRFPEDHLLHHNALKAGADASSKKKKAKSRKNRKGSSVATSSGSSSSYPILSKAKKTSIPPSAIFFPTNENEGCAESNGIGKKITQQSNWSFKRGFYMQEAVLTLLASWLWCWRPLMQLAS